MKCPFWDYPSYIQYCATNMRRGQDNVHLYDGEEGSGKSNGAAWDAKNIHESLGREPYNVAMDAIITKEEWNERFDSGEKMRVYVLDEFENIAFNRDFNKSENKEFIKLAQQARILRATIICVMPYLQFGDIYFRQGRFRVRVNFQRVTDFDVPCWKCGYDHEVREATYSWRQRSEDPETGEVVVRWEEIFQARHCPLALVDPEAWKGYESRKEESVRATALGRKRERKAEVEAAREEVGVAGVAHGTPKRNGGPTPARREKRRAMWGALSARDRILALAWAQDELAREGKVVVQEEPLTPPVDSNKGASPPRRKSSPEAEPD